MSATETVEAFYNAIARGDPAHCTKCINQAGVTDIEEIRFQPTLLNPDPDASLKSALAAAQDAATRAAAAL